MPLFVEVMPLLAAASLALFVGALLAEAMVLVPMWRSLQPQEFSDCMRRMRTGCTSFLPRLQRAQPVYQLLRQSRR